MFVDARVQLGEEKEAGGEEEELREVGGGGEAAEECGMGSGGGGVGEMEQRVRVRVRGKRESRGVARSECVPGKVEVSPVESGRSDVVLVGHEILWGRGPRHVSESGEVGGKIGGAS